jgi:uncharacterized membrane protein
MAQKAGMFAAFKAVFWSFFGIRKQRDYDSDAQNLSVKHVIIAGILAALLFIFGLIGLVYLVTKK